MESEEKIKTAVLCGFSVGLAVAVGAATLTIGRQRDEALAQLAARPCDMGCYTKAEAQAWISVYQHQCDTKPDLQVAAFRTFDEALAAEKALGCFRSADHSKKSEATITFDTRDFVRVPQETTLSPDWFASGTLAKPLTSSLCYFDTAGGITCPSGHGGMDPATCTDSK